MMQTKTSGKENDSFMTPTIYPETMLRNPARFNPDEGEGPEVSDGVRLWGYRLIALTACDTAQTPRMDTRTIPGEP